MITAPEQLQTNLDFVATHAPADTVQCLRQALARRTAASDSARLPGNRILAEDGRRLALHSERDPQGEAERLVERWWTQNHPQRDSVVVALGLGAGWHLRPLLDRLADNATVIVVDPNPDAAIALLHTVDLSALQRQGIGLHFLIDPEIDRLGLELHRILGTECRRLEVSLFPLPGALRAFPSLYRQLGPKLVLRTRMEVAERNTLYHLSRGWFANILRNLPVLLDSTPVSELRDRFQGQAAAVVCAGPSLDQSLDLLRQIQDRVLVVTVGTALRPLLKAGIRPHLVVVVDGCPEVWNQFRDLPEHESWFVGIAQTDPRVWAQFPGRAFSFATGAFRGFEEWLASFGAGTDYLAVGGTVSLTAIALASYMGCDRAWIWGLDLSFPDDGTSHAANSMYHGLKLDVKGLVRVPGNWRPTVATTAQFAQYVELIGAFACRDDIRQRIRLTNVNPDGARIRGLDLRTLAETGPGCFPVAPGCDFRTILAGLCRRHRGAAGAAVQAIEAMAAEIEAMRDHAGRAERLCREALAASDDTGGPAPDLAELETVEADLTRHTRAADLVELALHAVTLRTLAFSRRDDSSAVALNRALETSRELHVHVAEACDWVRVQLLDAREALGSRPDQAGAAVPAEQTRPERASPDKSEDHWRTIA